MGTSLKAIVKPELLVWARESIGFSLEDAANKMAQSPEKLSLWEKGEKQLTIPQLRKLASIYKRPLAVFFLSEPPHDFDVMKDFRTFTGKSPEEYSPELKTIIRDVCSKRDAVIELSELLQEKPLSFSLSFELTDDPDHIAREVRKSLGVDFETQTKWRDPFQALKGWIRAIEKLGVLVFQFGKVSIEEMRGFAMTEEPFPVIVINNKQEPNGRIFTLIHELMHVVLRMAGVSSSSLDLDNYKNIPALNKKIEAYCNRVAGAILVPSENLLAEPIVDVRKYGLDFTREETKGLAKKYNVSEEVIARRLVIIEKASLQFYEDLKMQLNKEYSALKDKKKGVFAVPFYHKVLNKSGLTLSRLAIEAYNNEEITSSDLSDYLEMRLKHLPGLEKEVFSIISK